MALETINKLLKGDSTIVEKYLTIKLKWDQILSQFDWNDDKSLEKLTRLVGDEQLTFEHLVDNRTLGQEIMVIVGICQFYDREVGFDKDFRKAKLLYNAFLSSYCSMEVKFITEEIGKMYRLEETLIDEDYENLWE